MFYESEVLLAKYQNKKVEEIAFEMQDIEYLKPDVLDGKEGIDVARLVKTRVNQSLFRKVVLNNYSNTCAICNLNIDSLLVASHILKWSSNQPNRLNPENGLCLCSIHDKAFELGYLGIRSNYKVLISPFLSHIEEKDTFHAFFKRHENQSIKLPDKFYPNPEFLEQHFKVTFIS